jgi:hypothetical protein
MRFRVVGPGESGMAASFLRRDEWTHARDPEHDRGMWTGSLPRTPRASATRSGFLPARREHPGPRCIWLFRRVEGTRRRFRAKFLRCKAIEIMKRKKLS